MNLSSQMCRTGQPTRYAPTDWLAGDTTESMTRFHADLETLVARGAVDGVTREPTATEDGFPFRSDSDIAQLLSKGPVA